MIQKSPAERLRMAGSMFESAKQLMRAGMLKEDPSLNEAQIRARTFMRLYGDEFSKDEIDRIMKRIPNMRLDENWVRRHWPNLGPTTAAK